MCKCFVATNDENMSNFLPLGVVSRGSEVQLQNKKKIT